MDIIEWLDNRGIKVNDPDLIREAFMHSSYANEHHGKHDNERLEFMGDAVLQLWSTNAIFPLNLSEGQMTRLRAQLVCEHALAIYGRKLHLNDFLLLDGDLIPLPSWQPFPSKDGLVFTYQQYEIAPYAAGMPAFTIPYEDIAPYVLVEVRPILGL